MRRLYWLLATIALLAVCPPMLAQNSALSGFCEVGAQTLTVQGLTIPQPVQASYPGCTVTVYLSGTITPATLFTPTGGSLSNPFTASLATGFWTFYVATGTTVDVSISGAGLPSTFTFPALTAGSTGGGGGGNPFAFPGVFTNTQMNNGVTSSVNGLTSNEFHSNNSGYATEAVSGAVAIPNTSTVQNSNAISGYTTNSSTATSATGGYFSSRSLANSAPAYGVSANAIIPSGLNPSLTQAAAALFNIANNTGTNWTTGNALDGINITSVGTNRARYGLVIQSSAVGNHWNTGEVLKNYSSLGELISGGDPGSTAMVVIPPDDMSTTLEFQGTNNADTITAWSIRDNGDIYGNSFNGGAITGAAINGTTLGLSSYADLTEIAAPANPASGRERWFANSSTHLLSCLTSTGGNCVPSGGGGGGGSPATPGAAVQFSNAGVTGFATASAGGVAFGVDSTSSPTNLTIPFSASIAGPRPYIDVTAYGAAGDNVHDDTSAIQAAINVYCNGQTLLNGGTIFFPPGTYKVSQPQMPSTSPVFTICTGLHLLGGNSALHESPGFIISPTVSILTQPGISPNAAPVFQCLGTASCGGGLTFENLTIGGYNQVVYIDQAAVNHFYNVALFTDQGATGMTDNTPLKICNSVWNWYEGGSLATNGATTIPALLLCSDSVSGPFQQVILSYFENVLFDNAGVVYRAGVANMSVPSGFIVFRNDSVEGSTTPFFEAEETTPGFLGGISNLTMDNVTQADSTPVPLIKWDATSALSGVFIKSASGGKSLIQMDEGTENEVVAMANGAADSNVQIVDASGNPFGNAITQNWSGFDYIADTTDSQRLSSDVKNVFASLNTGGFHGPPSRLTASGAAFASLATDPTGIYFGTGTGYGLSAYAGQTVANDIDFSFSNALPPTSVAGSATTGGTLPAATYYYWLTSTSAPGACNVSAPSLVSTGVVVGGSNNAVTVTWSVPPATGITTINDYCLFRSTLFPGTVYDPSAQEFNVSGGGTTTYTDTGGAGTGAENSPPIPTYTTRHRLAANALGINTTSPIYDLDVDHTNATNEGIRAYDNGGAQSVLTPSFLGINSTNGLWDIDDQHGSASFKGIRLQAATFQEQTSSGALSATSYDTCYGDSTAHAVMCSNNGGTYYPVALVNTILTGTNCSSAASPAVCGSAAAGSVTIAAGATTIQVNTSAVTANSQILVFPDETLGTKLSVTCNSTLATAAAGLAITARSAGVSFTISTLATVAVNPVCLSYVVVN